MAFLKSLISSLTLTSKSSCSTIHRSTVVHSRWLCSRPANNLEEGTEPSNINPIFRIATNHINKVALTDSYGSHTYQEILAKSLVLAKKIQQKIGVNKTQERIVFLCPNNVTYVLAQWACWASGHIGKWEVYFNSLLLKPVNCILFEWKIKVVEISGKFLIAWQIISSQLL